MSIPLQITIKEINQTPDLEEQIREKAEKLTKFCDNITACRVVLDLAQKHKQQGRLYSVHITLVVPGAELIAKYEKSEKLNISLREAFSKIRRQLEDYNQRQHGEVKTHAEQISGEVVRLFPEQDFGFIRSNLEGEEYYFHANNVVHPKFTSLKVGTKVHFIEAMGDEGPQAHRVSGIE